MVEKSCQWNGFAASAALHAAILLAVLKVVLPSMTPEAVPSPVPVMVQMVSAAALPQKQEPIIKQKEVKKTRPVAIKKTLPKPVTHSVAPRPSASSEVARHAPIAASSATTPSPTTNSQAATATVTSPQFDAAYLRNPAPEYPAAAKRRRMQGLVLLSVNVTAEGKAKTVILKKSSGFAPLDRAAQEAVAAWRFIPAKQGNQAVEASVLVPVEFKLQ